MKFILLKLFGSKMDEFCKQFINLLTAIRQEIAEVSEPDDENE